MRRISCILLSVVLVSTAVVSVAVDWNTTHLFNPDWHPHARFHDAVMLWLLHYGALVAMAALSRTHRCGDCSNVDTHHLLVTLLLCDSGNAQNELAGRFEGTCPAGGRHPNLSKRCGCNSQRYSGVDWLRIVLEGLE